MRSAGHALRLVTAAIAGVAPHADDWPLVLDIANRGWLVPEIYLALARSGELADIPLDVREYLSFLHDQNAERNRRLRGQLIESARALNAAGIEPILLKGAIHLFTAAERDRGGRMISDLDIHIDPVERGRATAALMELDYCALENAPELARPRDVGVIELHDRPNPRSAPYLSDDLLRLSSRVERSGVVAHIPCATARALHLVVHDMIKEGDHWTFRIDLRHLHDLAALARSNDGIDWHRLAAVMSSDPGRRALIGQAIALQDLFGVPVPNFLRGGRKAQLRHKVRLVAAGRGPSASAVRLVGNVLRTLHQIREGYTWRGADKFRLQLLKRFASRNRGSRV